MNIRKKRVLSLLLTIVVFIAMFSNVENNKNYIVSAKTEGATETDAAEESEKYTDELSDVIHSHYYGGDFNVDFVLNSQWDSGFNATITINNTGTEKIENWRLLMPLNNNIPNIWNASVADIYEDFYVIENAGWNQDIPIGGSVSFGITSYEAFSGFPEYYTIIGKKTETRISDYLVGYEVIDAWEEGIIGQITITSNRDSTIEDWRLCFAYEGEISEIWDAVILSHTDNFYEISCEDYNQNIEAGKSVSFGFKVKSDEQIDNPTNVILSEYIAGNYGKYISLMGYLDEENCNLELYVTSSEKCEKYIFYASEDYQPYEEIGFVSGENCFVYDITGKDNLELYVMGQIGNSTLSSEKIGVKKVEGKIVVVNPDDDEDGLCNYLEYIFGTDLMNCDTDADGLTDYYEIFITDTNPLSADSDDNGKSDDKEDFDEDGLINIEEQNRKTDPAVFDTDMDGLSDGDEINKYATNPLIADSDNDGLEDYDEIVLGFEPLDEDTDDNGVLDGDEKVEQNYKQTIHNSLKPEVTQVEVVLNISGNINKNVSINDVYNVDSLSSGVVGLVGAPVDITCLADFDKATITFTYDETKLQDVEPENLAVLWYDRSNNRYEIMDSSVDIDTCRVSCETTHFSTYMLVDRVRWFDAWRNNLKYRNYGDNEKPYNFSFVIDVSGSMKGQRIEIAKEALDNFVDAMKGDDNANIITFSSEATVVQEFTSDFFDLKDAIEGLTAYGGTNVNIGMRTSLEEFAEHTKWSDNNIMILLCDGDVNYSQKTIDDCIEKNIQVYTINVGSKSADAYLKKIASQTGGEYYYCPEAGSIRTVFGKLINTTLDDIDTTDSDGDGLYDVYETVGIQLQNGRIIYTDPNDEDTDDDGLSDYEEVGIPYSSTQIIDHEIVNVTYFQLRSDPTLKDTDIDGRLDSEDERPWDFDIVDSLLIYQSKYPKGKGLQEDGSIGKAEDLMYGDFNRNEILEIRQSFKYQIEYLDEFDDGTDLLYSEFRILAQKTSAGELETVALDMINHAKTGNGEDYYNDILTQKVFEHETTQRYIEQMENEIVRRIKLNGGNISSLAYSESKRENSNTLYYWAQSNTNKPKFNTLSDKLHGLTFCIDDTAGNTVEIRDYYFNGDTFGGTLHFCIYDNFGLGKSDVSKDKIYGDFAGFRAWYILQHCDEIKGAYIPYNSVMEFDVHFSGKL